jgi:hypothetical protein
MVGTDEEPRDSPAGSLDQLTQAVVDRIELFFADQAPVQCRLVGHDHHPVTGAT